MWGGGGLSTKVDKYALEKQGFGLQIVLSAKIHVMKSKFKINLHDLRLLTR